MSRVIRCSPEQLPDLITKDLQSVQEYVGKALYKTARDAVPVIRKRTPKAFGNLADSIHASGDIVPRTVVDAPHAAAVEVGSRPHTPDFEALLAWVKLRGAQGLTKRGGDRRRFQRSAGPSTAYQAVSVRQALKAEIQRGPNPYSPVDAPEQVARAIAAAIQVRGTKPHFFVRDSLDGIRAALDKNVRATIKGGYRESSATRDSIRLSRISTEE